MHRAHRQVARQRVQKHDRVGAAGQADGHSLAFQQGKRTSDGVRHCFGAAVSAQPLP